MRGSMQTGLATPKVSYQQKSRVPNNSRMTAKALQHQHRRTSLSYGMVLAELHGDRNASNRFSLHTNMPLPQPPTYPHEPALARNQAAIFDAIEGTRAAVDRIDGAEHTKRAQAAAETAETAANNATQNALRAGTAAEVTNAAAPIVDELQKLQKLNRELNRKLDEQDRKIEKLNQKIDGACCLIS